MLGTWIKILFVGGIAFVIIIALLFILTPLKIWSIDRKLKKIIKILEKIREGQEK